MENAEAILGMVVHAKAMGSAYPDANLPENIEGSSDKWVNASVALVEKARGISDTFEAAATGQTAPLDAQDVAELENDHLDLAKAHEAIANGLKADFPTALRAIAYHGEAAEAHSLAANMGIVPVVEDGDLRQIAHTERVAQDLPVFTDNGDLMQTGWKLSHPAFLLSQKAMTQTVLDTAQGLVKSESQDNIFGIDPLAKDAGMELATPDLEIIEWIEKYGTPGHSGEGPGHPFRGNAYTSGINAEHFNIRPGHENFNAHDHLHAATLHTGIANRLAAEGKMSQAASHFHEAAYHSTQAAARYQKPGGFTAHPVGQAAIKLYEDTQGARDAFREAAKAGATSEDRMNAQDAADKAAIGARIASRVLGQVQSGQITSGQRRSS